MLWHPLFTLTSRSGAPPPPVVQPKPTESAASDGLTVIYLEDPINEVDDSEVIELAALVIRMCL